MQANELVKMNPTECGTTFSNPVNKDYDAVLLATNITRSSGGSLVYVGYTSVFADPQWTDAVLAGVPINTTLTKLDANKYDQVFVESCLASPSTQTCSPLG